MSYPTDDIALVRKAQLGDKESLNRLAETARVRLHQYVLRLTLSEDLAQDIVQETILEMLRIFNKLKRAEMFWSWLHGIAFNKVRNHYGKRWRRKTRNFSETGYPPEPVTDNDTLAQVITEELKQIVLQSVTQLPPQHRAVLTMRCYDHLSYAQIAKLMACSEIGARAAFYRAKKSLARRLSEHGLSKGSLLLALVAFGKMTATSQAGAAQVAVTGATLQVGPLAALLATVTGKTGLIALATVSTLAAGSVALRPERTASILEPGSTPTTTLPATPWPSDATGQQECWYYFPEGPEKTVMLRLLQSDTQGNHRACRILQNRYANYHFDERTATVHIHNCRAWNPNLAVMRLPTDNTDLSDFIAQVEGDQADMELTGRRRGELLVICNRQGEGESRIWRVDRHVNVLDEEYFHVGWPQSTPVVDTRDAMHQRGWTYFRVTGQLGGRSVSGTGRLPFVYASAHKHSPWLKIRVGREATFVDTPTGASMYDERGLIAAQFPGGSLFQGLPRPWRGLHAIDTIRRDAAKQRLSFETTYDQKTGRAKVTVHAEDLSLLYTVNMEADLVETIGFFTERAGAPTDLGELQFVYLQEIPERVEAMFVPPPDIRLGATARQQIGILWLERLITSQ